MSRLDLRMGLLVLICAAAPRPGLGGPGPTPTSGSALPMVIPYETPLPEGDAASLAFLAERPGELVYCSMMLVVNEFGQLDNAFGVGCPNAMRSTALAAVEQWRFYPPTLGDRATTGRVQVQFAFVSHSVAAAPPLDEGAYLVRLGPVARPLWPSPPELSRSARRFLAEPPLCAAAEPGEPCLDLPRAEPLPGYRCLIDVEVAADGALANVLVVDCPGPLHDPVLRRMRRFGFEVEGARPGDGTVYRLDLWLAAR